MDRHFSVGQMVDEYRRPAISRFVLEHLGVNPGRVNNLFMVRVMFCHTTEGVFTAQHVLASLVHSVIKFAVNQSSEVQLIFSCSMPAEAEKLDREELIFMFDDKYVRFYKLESVSLSQTEGCGFSQDEPIVFPACGEGWSVIGYPRGFTDFLENMEHHTNPYMSESTMRLLNVAEREIERVLKVNIKNILSPSAFMDGSMFMKFDHQKDADFLANIHYFFRGRMIKFYKLQSLNKNYRQLDKSVKAPIYWRASREDSFKTIGA